MVIKELIGDLPVSEVQETPGNPEAKARICKAVFLELQDSEIIYRERVVSFANLKVTELRDDGFNALLKMTEFIYQSPSMNWDEIIGQEFLIGAKWEFASISQNHISFIYTGFTIWPEQDLVQQVRSLVKEGRIKEALKVLD